MVLGAPPPFGGDGNPAYEAVTSGQTEFLLHTNPKPFGMKNTNLSPTLSVPLSLFRQLFAGRQRIWLCLTLLAGMISSAQAQLTPADIVGPDGIIYPDWRQAGKPGGIPTNLVVRTSITNYSGFPNDNLDDASALEQAAIYAASQGGGVVSIPAGNFYLDRPVIITNDNVVLRGAGSGSTKFYFRYGPPTNAVIFYQPATNAAVRANTWIEIHADPNNLQILRIKYGATTISAVTNAPGYWGDRFFLTISGGSAIGITGSGTKTLTAIAEYSGGIVRSNNITVNMISGSDPNPNRTPTMLGAINFCGIGNTGSKFVLTANGVRGDTSITVTNGHGLVAGDGIELVAPATDRWDAEVENLCTGDLFRHYLYKITSVSGNVLTLNQPLRIDYPIIDGSYVQKFIPLRNCGVENFYLEQTKDLWTSGVVFSRAWECWGTGMYIKKAGRFPLYMLPAKWCEIRNCTMDDAWWKGDGGTAYVGWERAYDCLMENVTTYKMRHAPLVQWSAAGNVIRNSFFYDSDAQWHSGWTHENLFENNIVESNQGNGGYGYGMWASAPDDTQHGPNGPRNVIYHNDVTSPLASMWLGGQNREWLVLHNRFAADTGYGVYMKDNSGDHIIEGNVFALKSTANAVWLNDTNDTGVEVVNNAFYGIATQADIVGGATTAGVLSGNTVVDTLATVSFSNNGFESGLTGWVNTNDAAMSLASVSAKRTGNNGLRVTDTSVSAGSSLYSPTFAVQAGKTYTARYWSRTISGSGMGVYLKFFTATSNELQNTSLTIPSTTFWSKGSISDTAPAGASFARLWLHSYGASIVTSDFDDFEFGEASFELANSSFENGTNFWDFTGDNSMSQILTNAAKVGTYGLRVTDNSATLGSSVMSSSFPITMGNTYQCRFWGRITSGSGAAVYLQFLNSSGAAINPPTYEEIPTNTTEWRQYIVRGEPPAGAVSVRVWIHSYSGSVVTAEFGDLTLSEVAPRPVPALPSIYDWQKNPWIPFNLGNPGFESGTNSWDFTTDGGMSTVTSTAHSGTKGLHVVDSSTTAGSSVASAKFAAEAGKNYQTRFYAKTVSGSGLGVYIQFFNTGGTNIGQTNLTVGASTSWTPYTLNGQAPANTATARVWVHSYSANTVTADLDDFEFGEYGLLP